MTRYRIIAYPDGARQVVGQLAGGCAEGVVWHATQLAKTHESYLDVERERDGVAKCIAVVGPEGPVAA